MPDIKVRASAMFTVGNGKLIEYFKSPDLAPMAGGYPCTAVRLPCAFVFANKEDMRP